MVLRYCGGICLAPCGRLVCVLVDDLAHQAQHTPYNVADYDLAWLR